MHWYEDDIKRLEDSRSKIGYEPETIFYGSSSIRMWNTLYTDFSGIKPINLGFGGSTLAACVWFFERVMQPYQPKRLIIYAGDNDLGDGRNPEEVFIFFQELVVRTAKRFGDLPCYYISLKPSVSRWNMVDKFRYANTLIKDEIAANNKNWQFIDVFDKMLDAKNQPKREYFANDGLHLSDKGYQVWRDVVNNSLAVNS